MFLARATAGAVQQMAAIATRPFSSTFATRFEFFDDMTPAAQAAAPVFTVGRSNGFLPTSEPLASLPEAFQPLEDILNDMPITRDDGTPGLLADGSLGARVRDDFPLLDTSKVTDPKLMAALWRDYTFLASAYLLEPCDLVNRKSGSIGRYGIGRDVLPASIAKPLVEISDRLKIYPFMEYAMSYALYNWKKKDASQAGISYENLELIRKFQGGPSEHGFILVHVSMVAHTGRLVQAIEQVLTSCERRDRSAFDAAMLQHRSVMCDINAAMETMWAHSAPKDYMEYRTFIFGTKNQPMFPNGVIYEGVDDAPRFYRGESGANDSIIPSCDNLWEIPFPENPLTDILKDFRTYRPQHHNAYLTHLKDRATALHVQKFALETTNSAALFLSNLDQVREFRSRHWSFAKEYILKYSRHPVATGGSPIATWLPNQLRSVLVIMSDAIGHIANSSDTLPTESRTLYDSAVSRSKAQIRILDREVEKAKENIDKF